MVPFIRQRMMNSASRSHSADLYSDPCRKEVPAGAQVGPAEMPDDFSAERVWIATAPREGLVEGRPASRGGRRSGHGRVMLFTIAGVTVWRRSSASTLPANSLVSSSSGRYCSYWKMPGMRGSDCLDWL